MGNKSTTQAPLVVERPIQKTSSPGVLLQKRESSFLQILENYCLAHSPYRLDQLPTRLLPKVCPLSLFVVLKIVLECRFGVRIHLL